MSRHVSFLVFTRLNIDMPVYGYAILGSIEHWLYTISLLFILHILRHTVILTAYVPSLAQMYIAHVSTCSTHRLFNHESYTGCSTGVVLDTLGPLEGLPPTCQSVTVFRGPAEEQTTRTYGDLVFTNPA